jgi:hypothetical protein
LTRTFSEVVKFYCARESLLMRIKARQRSGIELISALHAQLMALPGNQLTQKELILTVLDELAQKKDYFKDSNDLLWKMQVITAEKFQDKRRIDSARLQLAVELARTGRKSAQMLELMDELADRPDQYGQPGRTILLLRRAQMLCQSGFNDRALQGTVEALAELPEVSRNDAPPGSLESDSAIIAEMLARICTDLNTRIDLSALYKPMVNYLNKHYVYENTSSKIFLPSMRTVFAALFADQSATKSTSFYNEACAALTERNSPLATELRKELASARSIADKKCFTQTAHQQSSDKRSR